MDTKAHCGQNCESGSTNRRRGMSRADREYEADVAYEVWRYGGNPDEVDAERCQNARDDGYDADAYAHRLLREQRRQRDKQEAR